MTISIGFSGTRRGATASQLAQLETRLVELHQPGAEFHHGDCVGSDAQAHDIARRLGYRIVGHPPVQAALRAWCDCDELRRPAPYVERDSWIVAESDRLLATPDGPKRPHSGTWLTIGIADADGVAYEVIYP